MARNRAKNTALKPQPVNNDTFGVVFRSSLAGAAGAMLVAAIASPAGLGGMIGVAEGMGVDPRAPDTGADGANLPAMTQQLSIQDLSSIQQTLDQSMAQMQAVRAQTDDEINHLHFVVETDGLQIRS